MSSSKARVDRELVLTVDRIATNSYSGFTTITASDDELNDILLIYQEHPMVMPGDRIRVIVTLEGSEK